MYLRIKDHPILDFKEKRKIYFYFNGKKIEGLEGDTIASALHANGIKVFSRSLKLHRPRGFFCGIGKCSSCLMRVEGIPNVRTCLAQIKEGIHVEMQDRLPDLPSAEFKAREKETIDIDVLVVGAGPAGLSATIEASKHGAKVLLVDENNRIGGQLIKQTHKFFGSKNEKAGTRGIDIANELGNEIRDLEKRDLVKVMLNSTVIGYYEGEKNKHKLGAVRREDFDHILCEINCKKVIFACGAMENMLLFPGNDLPGVYGAGAVQTLMNVYGVKPGNKVIMVGAGNVGLIVSYQLLQAGIEVDRVIEAAPLIGGYHVHAAKLRRCGVPIYTSHSIKEAYGKDRVEGAVVVKLDENWKQIEGTEEDVECDTICLAVGLTPSIRLLSQANVDIEFIPEAGGYVALHNEEMETSVKGIYVAGDSSGIEEASTAIIEGKIAGLSAAYSLGYAKDKKDIKNYIEQLEKLRAGPFGKKARVANSKIKSLYSERYERV